MKLRHLSMCVGAGPFLLISTLGSAEVDPTLELLRCRSTASICWYCSLREEILAEPIQFGGVTYETEYRLEYSFPCQGHRADVGALSGGHYAAFSQGVDRGYLTGLIGPGPAVSWDPDPERTRRLMFGPGCHLRILAVEALAAPSTVNLWRSESESQAKVIALALGFYRAAQDYRNIRVWDHGKLELLKAKLERLTQVYPNNPHYWVMLETVVSALENAPAPHGVDLVAHSAEEVVAELARQLEAEVATGRDMLTRFETFGLGAEESLQEVLEGLS